MSMVGFIVFDTSTGSYLGHGQCGEDGALQQAAGFENASAIMVDAIPTPAGYFNVDVAKIDDPAKVYAFGDVTTPREPTESEAAIPDIIAAQAWSAIVNAERDRRIVAGKTFDGIALTGREEDIRNLTNLALAAQMRLGQADTTTLTTFRDGENVYHDLTPMQIISLWQQAAAYVSDIYTASWAIKDAVPVPADATDDALWP